MVLTAVLPLRKSLIRSVMNSGSSLSRCWALGAAVELAPASPLRSTRQSAVGRPPSGVLCCEALCCEAEVPAHPIYVTGPSLNGCNSVSTNDIVNGLASCLVPR